MLTYFVIVPALIAIFLYLFSSNRASRVVAIIAQTIFVLFTLYLFLESRQGDILTVVGGYRGVLGITLKADMLSSALVMLTAILFLLAAFYGIREENSKLYWLLMFIWQGLIIGIFLSRDFFNVFVLLEVATLIVAVLIMYLREKRSMFDGVIFIMINTAAIQFYLLGIGYIYMITGTMDMAVAATVIAEIEPRQLILPYVLIMTPIAFKCALVPLASWLPKVQGIPRAPSAVAAILSGLHVKCALFLFIRFQEVFAPIATSGFFLILGSVTAILSIIMAFSQKDIRLVLAYSSTAQIGLIMIGLNLGGDYAYVGSFYHIINHAVFKTALFLSAGIIVRMYKTRDMTKIRGLFKGSPLLATTTLFAILGIIGAPFFNGSISKYFLMAETNGVTFWLINLINLGTITIFIKFITMLFGRDTSDKTVKINGSKQAAVLALGAMCLLMGVGGIWLVDFLFGKDVSFSAWGYFEKAVIFAFSFVVAILINWLLQDRVVTLHRISKIDLNFKGMCVSLGVLFAIMLVVVEVVM